MTEEEIKVDEDDAPKRGRPSYADVKAQLDKANQVIERMGQKISELEANASKPSEGFQEPASEPPPAGPRKRIKVLIHKKMTSMGRVLGGDFEELPVEEADAMIAAGEAEEA